MNFGLTDLPLAGVGRPILANGSPVGIEDPQGGNDVAYTVTVQYVRATFYTSKESPPKENRSH